MSGNTSATGGYLAPVNSSPYDAALDAIIQPALAGISGLPGALVRPSWQNAPSPSAETDWCAFAVKTMAEEDYPAVQHIPTADGHDEMEYDEALEVACVFYGPNARGNAARLRDGFKIPQNREALRANKITFESASPPSYVPELINQTVWLPRCDITLTLKRRVHREYAVRNLESAAGTIAAETSTISFDTEPSA